MSVPVSLYGFYLHVLVYMYTGRGETGTGIERDKNIIYVVGTSALLQSVYSLHYIRKNINEFSFIELVQ